MKRWAMGGRGESRAHPPCSPWLAPARRPLWRRRSARGSQASSAPSTCPSGAARPWRLGAHPSSAPLPSAASSLARAAACRWARRPPCPAVARTSLAMHPRAAVAEAAWGGQTAAGLMRRLRSRRRRTACRPRRRWLSASPPPPSRLARGSLRRQEPFLCLLPPRQVHHRVPPSPQVVAAIMRRVRVTLLSMAVVLDREVEIPGALTSATGLDDRTPGAVAAARDADIAAAAATAGAAGEVSSVPRIGSGSAARADQRHRGFVSRAADAAAAAAALGSPSRFSRDFSDPTSPQQSWERTRRSTPVPSAGASSIRSDSPLGTGSDGGGGGGGWGGSGSSGRWTPSPIPDVTDDILGDVLQVRVRTGESREGDTEGRG